jgi:hypothetical protein
VYRELSVKRNGCDRLHRAVVEYFSDFDLGFEKKI